MQEMWEMPPPSDRRYTIPDHSPGPLRRGGGGSGAEDLHAWSIYRQNLNSDFTDSALGSDERSPLPYGNFQLREQTVQSILRHPRLAPRSELGSNMYAYLKFGLPRVFPPVGGGLRPLGHAHKDTSSGYDSADERNHSPMNPNPGGGRSRSRMTDRTLPERVSRARSETDLRDGMVNNRFVSAASKERRLRSANSETNLINDRPMSKNGSQISLVSRNSRPGLVKGMNGHSFYSPMQGDGGNEDSQDAYYEYPHLQVRGLCCEINKGGKSRILDGISFDLHGGELLAIMSTTAFEGTTLLDILARRCHTRDRIAGDFLLNGNPVTVSRLGTRVAYVRRDYRLHPDITVAQTMQFHALLRKPIRSASQHEKGTRMNILLEELGLAAVRHSLVESLTSAERQRLAVACQLLLDTDIVLLDQPTRGMDIFDTFFLVDYLRQWGARAKIILMTIHPPTFEIFSMFTKVALISTGRLMFYGHRKEMLPYFAFIEYPCPGFKNPSDYYLDLVTLDDLSAEALLESSQRIETLADSYRRKQEPLSDPGPPQPLPPRVKVGGLCSQLWAVWMYTLVYTFPWNVVRWLVFMLMSAGLSIVVGAIFWNVRLTHTQDQNSASDRVGIHWVLMCLTSWPVLLMLAARDVANIQYVTRDNEERLYSKAAYILAKTIIELPFIISIFLAYVIPAYVMAGINNDDRAINNFYIFVGYMVLYLYGIRSLLLATIHQFRNILVATTLSGLVFFICALCGLYSIHWDDLGGWRRWVRYVSPISWLFQPLIKDELANVESLSCPKNPVTQENNIVKQVDCNINDGMSALAYFSLKDSWPTWIPILVTFGLIFVCLTASIMGFILRRHAPAIPPPEKP